jgi:hypothetical protein
MSGNYAISVDPSELATRFAYQEPIEEESDDFKFDFFANLERVHELLPKIPEREADLIELYFETGLKQAAIAQIFGVTQAAVSYRLERGIHRLKFLISLPQVTEEEMRADLPYVPFKKVDVDILVGMWVTTCQSEVATRLNLTQGNVRHRFFEAVKLLEKRGSEEPKFTPYAQIFSSIANNFTILKFVELPQWKGRGQDCCF